MSISVDYKTVVSRGALVLVNKSVAGVSEQFIDFALDPLLTATNVVKAIAFIGNDLVAISISSDKDLTVTVNDDGTPDLTINLLANTPYIWKDDGYITNPFAGLTVATIKFANASGATATITGFVQHDPAA